MFWSEFEKLENLLLWLFNEFVLKGFKMMKLDPMTIALLTSLDGLLTIQSGSAFRKMNACLQMKSLTKLDPTDHKKLKSSTKGKSCRP